MSWPEVAVALGGTFLIGTVIVFLALIDRGWKP